MSFFYESIPVGRNQLSDGSFFNEQSQQPMFGIGLNGRIAIDPVQFQNIPAHTERRSGHSHSFIQNVGVLINQLPQKIDAVPTRPVVWMHRHVDLIQRGELPYSCESGRVWAGCRV